MSILSPPVPFRAIAPADRQLWPKPPKRAVANVDRLVSRGRFMNTLEGLTDLADVRIEVVTLGRSQFVELVAAALAEAVNSSGSISRLPQSRARYIAGDVFDRALLLDAGTK